MVTAQSITRLCEDYFNTKKVFNREVVIYRNPTTSDYKELMRVIKSAGVSDLIVRFIADAKKQSIYIWDARLANHDNISDLVGFSWVQREYEYWVITGDAEINGSRLVVSSWRGLFYYPIKWLYTRPEDDYSGNIKKRLFDFFACNWSFVDKYLPGFAQELNKIKAEAKNSNNA